MGYGENGLFVISVAKDGSETRLDVDDIKGARKLMDWLIGHGAREVAIMKDIDLYSYWRKGEWVR